MLTLILVAAIGVLLYRVHRVESRVARLQSELDRLARRLAATEPVPPPLAVPPPAAAAPGPAAISAPASPPPPPDPRRATTPASLEPDESLEGRIGGRLLLYAGMIVLVLGVTFFLRYAFENEWLPPAVRVLCGGAAGVVMAGGGLRLARDYRSYGLFITGGGVAVLFLSVYAALNRYDLIAPQTAFVLFVAITAGAAYLADRADALALAVVSVCGGFATPFLVGGTRDEQVLLFSYAAVLIAATWYLARRRGWPWLDVLSLLLTIVTCAAWFDRFYTRPKYLTSEAFLTIYCVMFVAMLRDASRSSGRDARLVAALLLAAPVIYHAASIALLAPHRIPFLVYMIAVTAVAVVVGLHVERPVVRGLAWVAVALPLFAWIGAHQAPQWAAASVIASVAVFALHLAAQVRTLTAGELSRPDVLLLHANGIGVFVALYEALTPVATVPQLALLALAVAAFHFLLSWTMRARTPATALHWLGVALTLVAVAMSIQFDGPWAIAMWSTEGAVVFWIASRTQANWLRAGAWILFVLAALRWLQGDIQETSASHVVIANARALSGLYVVAMLYLVSWLQRREESSVTAATRSTERAIVLVAASALTVFVMTTEITSYWAVRRDAEDAYVARELMLSAAWAAYAATLVVVGIRRRYAPIRYFAIALFALTLAKVFIVDLETLGGIYRITGFIVVGAILLLVSFLYQRARVGRAEGP